MRNIDEQVVSEVNDVPKERSDRGITARVSRRDFLKLSAILSGSTVLLLNGCGFLEELDPQVHLDMPPLPQAFKRFTMTRIETGFEQPTITEIAIGSQHQNMQVSLVAYDQPIVQIYDSVQDLLNVYSSDGPLELRWLD
jgi:hypothetical protein